MTSHMPNKQGVEYEISLEYAEENLGGDLQQNDSVYDTNIAMNALRRDRNCSRDLVSGNKQGMRSVPSLLNTEAGAKEILPIATITAEDLSIISKICQLSHHRDRLFLY